MKSSKKGATLLAAVALGAAKTAANSRCAYCFHQPKMPANVKKLKKD